MNEPASQQPPDPLEQAPANQDPQRVARQEARRLAELLAPTFGRTRGGLLHIPAGELDAQPLQVPKRKLWEVLLESRSGRRWMAARSIKFFMAWHLGLYTPDCQLRWLERAHQHRRTMIEAPRDHGKSLALNYTDILWRIAMSSTCIGPGGVPQPGLVSWVPANIRILSMTRGGKNARKRLQAVRQTLEHRQELLDDFGPFRVRGRPWNDSQIYCQRNHDGLKLSDPTVEAVSVEGAITGGRFDHAVFDDVEDRQSVNTSEQRAKGREDIANAMELLEEDGTASAIGTRKHADDWYARTERNPSWRVFIDRAFMRWPGGTKTRDETQWRLRTRREPVDPEDPTRGWVNRIEGFDHIAPGAVVLWPEKWNVERLLRKYEDVRAVTGSWYFMREQQQQVVDDTNAMFPGPWWDRAKAKGRRLALCRTLRFDRQRVERTGHQGRADLPPGLEKWLTAPWWRPGMPERERLLIFQSWDMSLVDEEGKLLERDNDYTVGLTWGLNWETGQRVILDIFRARWISEGQKEEAVKLSAELWMPQEIAIERNAFQAMHIAHLRRDTDLPIHGHYTGSNKRDPFKGVPALAALLETRDGDPTSGRLVLPYSQDQTNDLGRELIDVLVTEARGLGVEPHDDLLMALWIGHSLITQWIEIQQGRQKRAQAWAAKTEPGRPTNGDGRPAKPQPRRRKRPSRHRPEL